MSSQLLMHFSLLHLHNSFPPERAEVVYSDSHQAANGLGYVSNVNYILMFLLFSIPSHYLWIHTPFS